MRGALSREGRRVAADIADGAMWFHYMATSFNAPPPYPAQDHQNQIRDEPSISQVSIPSPLSQVPPSYEEAMKPSDETEPLPTPYGIACSSPRLPAPECSSHFAFSRTHISRYFLALFTTSPLLYDRERLRRFRLLVCQIISDSTFLVAVVLLVMFFFLLTAPV